MRHQRAPAANKQGSLNSNSEHLGYRFTGVLRAFVDFYPKLWYDKSG